jgi:hypothetical protein
MACPAYSVMPGGNTFPPAAWGGTVTLAASGSSFGSPPGTVQLVCADNTHPILLKQVVWTASTIVVTLPPTSPCTGPYHIAVNTATDNDCQEPIEIAPPGGDGGRLDLPALAQSIVQSAAIWPPPTDESEIGQDIVIGIVPQKPADFDLLGGSLVKRISMKVSYRVTALAGPPHMLHRDHEYSLTPAPVSSGISGGAPLSPFIPPDSDPFQAALTIFTPFGVDTAVYEVGVNVEVNVDGNLASHETVFPLIIRMKLALPIPSVFLLSKDANHSGELFILVRQPVGMNRADDIVMALTRLIQAGQGFGTLMFDWVNVLRPIQLAIDTITKASKIVGIGSREVGNLGDYDGFDNEASSCLLIAPTGTQVEVWNDDDFSGEESVFKAKDLYLEVDAGGTGVGFVDEMNWSSRWWDSDPGDSMNDDAVSVRFVLE